MRAAIVIAVAVPLALADLAWKHLSPAPDWAYHERSPAWLALSVCLLGVLLALTRVPSTLVLPAAGVLAGGVLGNALSASWNDLRVPNPIVVEGESAVIAFTLADLFVLAGIVLLTASLAATLLRHRHLLPEPREARGRLRRRF